MAALPALARKTAVVRLRVATARAARADWAQEVWRPAAERAAASDRRPPKS